jgi:hypothetical protein
MKLTSIILSFYLVSTSFSQQDSIYIGFDYNRDQTNFCSYWYAMNDVYKVPLKDSTWLQFRNFSYVQPIEQQFCDVLTISAFRHEMTKYPKFNFDYNVLVEKTKEQIDSIAWSKKVPIIKSVSDKYAYENPLRIELNINEYGTYQVLGVIDGVYISENKMYFVAENYFDVFPQIKDSLEKSYLLLRRKEIQPKVDEFMKPFYFSNSEISNYEYSRFINWVKDSIAFHKLYDTLPNEEACQLLKLSKKELRQINPNLKKENLQQYGFDYQINIYEHPDYHSYLSFLYHRSPERFYKHRILDVSQLEYKQANWISINVYPDTLKIIENHPNLYIQAMSHMYFWHPAYYNYPIHSISYNQAMAYCAWRQRELNQEFEEYGITVSYELPSIYQYEMANKFNQPRYGKHHLENFSNSQFITKKRDPNEESVFVMKILHSNPAIKPFKKHNKPKRNEKVEDLLMNVILLKQEQWSNSNISYPICFLNGNVSEYASNTVTRELIKFYEIDSTGIDMNHLDLYCLILGSNARLDVIDKTGNQNNAIFYKQLSIKSEVNPYVGFRPVMRIEENNLNDLSKRKRRRFLRNYNPNNTRKILPSILNIKFRLSHKFSRYKK